LSFISPSVEQPDGQGYRRDTPDSFPSSPACAVLPSVLQKAAIRAASYYTNLVLMSYSQVVKEEPFFGNLRGAQSMVHDKKNGSGFGPASISGK